MSTTASHAASGQNNTAGSKGKAGAARAGHGVHDDATSGPIVDSNDIEEAPIFSIPTKLAAYGMTTDLDHLAHDAKKKALLAEDRDGMPAVCHACRNGEHEALHLLLEAAGHEEAATLINARGWNGRTPAMLAAGCPQGAAAGGEACIAELVVRGADLSLKDEAGNTALHHAARSGYLGVLKLLVQPGHALRDRGKHLTAMESTQISSGIVINATDQHGKTALHLAANSGQISAVNYLLEHKADVTASDNSGSTPLHVAAAAGFAHICAKLIEAGAEVDAMDSHGHSPLMVSTTHAVTAVLRGQQLKEGEVTSPKAN